MVTMHKVPLHPTINSFGWYVMKTPLGVPDLFYNNKSDEYLILNELQGIYFISISKRQHRGGNGSAQRISPYYITKTAPKRHEYQIPGHWQTGGIDHARAYAARYMHSHPGRR